MFFYEAEGAVLGEWCEGVVEWRGEGVSVVVFPVRFSLAKPKTTLNHE
jgi:hypothetical protein